MTDAAGYLAGYLTTITDTEQTEVRSAILTLLGIAAVSDGDKGDIVVSGSSWTIDSKAVIFSKFQDIANARVLGRKTAGSGSVEELSASDLKTLFSFGTAANLNTGTSAGQIPILDGSGLLDASILPALAITDTFEVSSQSAMLALTAQRGDVAVRSDLSKSFILKSNSPSTLADWVELLTPTAAVASVAGLTGTISSSGLKTALSLDSVSSPQFTGIELGHATDTTITRYGAGVIAVEGVPIYPDMPQNSQSAAYTLVLGDAQKHIFHPAADTTARTWTIPANASVPYRIGTAITFINENGAGVITIAITSDTMRLAGAGTTGSRTLAANGIATAVKVTSTSWIISGVGLT